MGCRLPLELLRSGFTVLASTVGANRRIYARKNAVIASPTCSATRLCHVRGRYSFYIMPLHPWQFQHLALGNGNGCGERITSFQRAVCDIMGEDWHVQMRSGVTNVVDLYTDVPTDHQLDLDLSAMAMLWDSRNQGQSVRRLQYNQSTSTSYCLWVKVVSV